MAEHADEILSAICEIRDLVRLLAEPAIAARDQKARNELRRIVGNSAAKAKAVVLMDGRRTQRAIHRETGINEGQLSTLVKQLNASEFFRIASAARVGEEVRSLPWPFESTIRQQTRSWAGGAAFNYPTCGKARDR
jgi:hypothetical protein